MTFFSKLISRSAYLLLLFLFLIPAALFAQNILSGTVTDSKGQPVAGVTVSVKGGKTTATTADNGTFTINAATGATLVFTAINFDAVEQKVGAGNTVTISLKERTTSLNDVVVVGYGTRRKRDLTGTVSTLGGEEVVAARAQSIQEALQGRLAGVDVKRGNGRPGTDMIIEIRGANSIAGNTQPLYVIDGIVVGNINEISPSDIERIDVLKDASSTAIYGSRGANGVVIVTTKRGVKGPPRVSYDAYVGIVNPYNLPPVMNGPRFVDYVREYNNTQALYSNPPQPTPVPDNRIFSTTELANIASGTYTDWISKIKQNGLQTNHNLSLTGGTETMTYYLSAGYQYYEGALKATDVSRYNLKVGVDITPNKAMKFGASIISNYSDFDAGSPEAFRSAYRLRPTGSAFNADGSKRFFPSEGESQITNPLFDFDNEIRKRQYVKVIPNLYMEVNFLQNFKFRTSFTPDLLFQRTGSYYDVFSKTVAGIGPSRADNGAQHYFNYSWDNILTYNKELGNHKFDVTAGSTINYVQYDFNNISVRGLPYKSLWFNVGNLAPYTQQNGNIIQPTTAVASGYSKQTVTGFFGRANYSFKNKYLLTLTGRSDGNSIFSPGKKWGFFPSAGLAWIVSEEGFMQSFKNISLLKLRFAIGKSGNAALNPGLIEPFITQSVVGPSQYDFNGASANGFLPARLADKSLTWEKTTEYNGGLELNLFRNRIGFTMDIYNKTARGSILPLLIPTANGFGSVVTNIGVVRNSGIELNLMTQNIRSKKLTWTTNINFAKNKNKLIELYGDGRDDLGNQKFIGQKVRVVYNYKILGVWQNEEAAAAATFGQKPGQYKIDDVNKDKKIDLNDRQINGSSLPDWFGGITNNVTYANFDFGFTVYTRQGTFQQSTFLAQYMNGDQGRARFGAFDREYWTPAKQSTRWANLVVETDGAKKSAAEYINSSYTKVSNISLGYTFPGSIVGKSIKRLRVYADAYNPFIFTKFIGWDPETADANSFGDVDFRMRTFIFGVNLSF